MLFSIIIPTYNRAGIIVHTLKSVLSQEFRDFEIVVVDDGSTDETGDVVRKINDPRIKYYFKKNEERAVARNFGADRSSGQYLIFLDSDDKFAEHHLSNVAGFIEQKDAEFIFSGYRISDNNLKTVYSYGTTGQFNKRRLAYGNYLGCSSVVIKRELFNSYRFSEDRSIILFEDWELWLRVIQDIPLWCIDSRTIIMDNHSGRSVLSASATALAAKGEALISTVKNISFINDSLVLRRKFRMGVYSYIALHVALGGSDRKIAMNYLAKSLFEYPNIIFQKRFWATLRRIR